MGRDGWITEPVNAMSPLRGKAGMNETKSPV